MPKYGGLVVVCLMLACGRVHFQSGPRDSSTSDAAGALDSSAVDDDSSVGDADAMVEPDAGLPATMYFCDTRPEADFCWDFDDPSRPSPWDRVASESALTLDSTALSAPSALRILLPASTETCRWARYDKIHKTPPITRARFEWAFRLGPALGDPGFDGGIVSQLLIQGLPGADICALFVSVSADGSSSVVEQDILIPGGPFIGSSTPIPIAFEAERFARAAFEVTLTPTPRYTFSVDGVPVIVDQPMEPECAGPATYFETNAGLHCHGATTRTTELHIDDIVVDLGP